MLPALAALVPLVALMALAACSSPEEPGPLEVTWSSSESGPACTYDPVSGSVDASLAVSGSGSARVVLTAYADEDTTRPVGSRTATIRSGGEQRVDQLSFQVRRAPYVDVDGVAACSLDVRP